MAFLLRDYVELLLALQNKGYSLGPVKDYFLGYTPPFIFLRHDVDRFSARALNMATAERCIGVTSTYYFRSGSGGEFPCEHIMSIASMGHEIGLHFDGIPFIGSSGKDLASVFKKDKELLEAMFNIEIVSASLHAFWTLPVPDYFGFSVEELGIENYAYSPKFTKDMKYISDSRGGWREGCPCSLLGKYPKIQCLTHPYWWYEKREDAYDRW